MNKISPDVVPGARVCVKIKGTDVGETTTGELVGTVEQVDDTSVPLKLRGYGWLAACLIESVEVLARPRMAEPPAGTTVRHAGSIFARPVGQAQPGIMPWLWIDLHSVGVGTKWTSWDEVLELDTANEPEVIDPRSTAPEAADTAAPAPGPQPSGLGARAADHTSRAVSSRTAREVWSARASARQLADAVTLLSRDLAQVEGALAAAKQRDKDAADATRRVITTVANALTEVEHRFMVTRDPQSERTAVALGGAVAALIDRAARL